MTMDTRPPGYERSQTFRLLWLVLPLATLLTSAVLLDETQGRGAPVPLAAWFAALGMPALALLLLGRLTIQVDAQRVRWHFGFLGWPRWSVALADIAHVETTRLRWWEGQGIRFTFDGRLYNVASGGAVRLTLHDGKRIRLGSDEPERLAAWIGHRIGSG
jgi:hypothetical protein